MASAMQRLRNFVQPSSARNTLGAVLDPELGFKVNISESTKELKIIVIGARHLPTLYGLTRADGYVIKVKLFPGKEKYETKLQKESWPVFNQEFLFELATNSSRIEEQLSGKFIVLTVYAILESNKHTEESKSRGKLSSESFRSFFGRGESGLKLTDSKNKSERVSLYKRRTVGAVTYNLDARVFTQKLRNNCLGTPDVWRPVKSISSGLVQPNKNVDNNKGAVEVTLTYSISEDGKNDMIFLSLSRLRFTVQTMETHENYTGSLYIKMKIYECDVLVAKWKSDKFEPTISLKLEQTAATLQATVRNTNLYAVKCELRLMCKNKLGKKTELGKLNIGPSDGQWIQALDSPCTPTTLWHYFK